MLTQKSRYNSQDFGKSKNKDLHKHFMEVFEIYKIFNFCAVKLAKAYKNEFKVCIFAK